MCRLVLSVGNNPTSLRVVRHVIPHPVCHVITHPVRVASRLWASHTGSLDSRNRSGEEGADGEEKFRRVRLIEFSPHWHAGSFQRPLAESVGIDRKTIAKFWRRRSPRIRLLTPGVEPDHLGGVAAHVARWFPELSRSRTAAKTGRHRS